MRKFKLFLLISALCLVSATTASAYDFEVDGIYYNLTPGITVAVACTQDGYSGEVTIPSTVNCNGVTYSVTRIEEMAFAYSPRLTSITIPESVTSIGYGAFDYCSNLTAVHISNIESWCKISFVNISSNPLSKAENLYLNRQKLRFEDK